MVSPKKVKVEKLKEIVIHIHKLDISAVIMQVKESYKGEILYQIRAELKFEGKPFGYAMLVPTASREVSDYHFSELKNYFPESWLTSKIS